MANNTNKPANWGDGYEVGKYLATKRFVVYHKPARIKTPSNSTSIVRRIGTKAGNEALDYYANLFNQGTSEGIKGTGKVVLGVVGGFFSALWTDETAGQTSAILSVCVPGSAFVMNTLTIGGGAIEEVIEFHDPVIPNLSEVKLAAQMCKHVYNDDAFGPIGFGVKRLSVDDIKSHQILKHLRSELIELFHNKRTNAESGFAIGLYYAMQTNKYYLAFRGTENNSAENAKKDWATNLKQGIGIETKQHDAAMKLAGEFKRLNFLFVSTGHSLGGGLAASAAAKAGVQGITFNAAGVNNATLNREQIRMIEKSITNYSIVGEILTTLQEYSLAVDALGTTVYIWPAVVPWTAEEKLNWNTKIKSAASYPITLHLMDAVIASLENL